MAAFPSTAWFRAIDGVLQAAVPAGLKIAANPIPLSEVEQAWPREDGMGRIVFTIAA